MWASWSIVWLVWARLPHTNPGEGRKSWLPWDIKLKYVPCWYRHVSLRYLIMMSNIFHNRSQSTLQNKLFNHNMSLILRICRHFRQAAASLWITCMVYNIMVPSVLTLSNLAHFQFWSPSVGRLDHFGNHWQMILHKLREEVTRHLNNVANTT